MIETGPICVIFNPTAGRGQARRMIRKIRGEMRTELHLRPTKYPGHAVELARKAAEEGYPVIAAAGGDGTVHEVANGILRAERPETIFAVWPVGSANDYAFALGVSSTRSPLAPRVDGPQIAPADGMVENRGPSTRGAGGLQLRTVDVGRVEGGGKSAYFVNCLGVGFNGAVTLEARRISWLRGMPLYGLATLKALWRHFGQPIMKVQFDEMMREVPTLAISVNLGVREGNFPVTPAAKLDDGWFDAIHAGPLTRWQALKLLPRMATGTLPFDHPNLWMGRCRNVRVVSPVPIRVHLDGEFFCQPEDGISEIRVEMLARRLRVLSGRAAPE